VILSLSGKTCPELAPSFLGFAALQAAETALKQATNHNLRLIFTHWRCITHSFFQLATAQCNISCGSFCSANAIEHCLQLLAGYWQRLAKLHRKLAAVRRGVASTSAQVAKLPETSPNYQDYQPEYHQKF
jgi:hypothetical protein